MKKTRLILIIFIIIALVFIYILDSKYNNKIVSLAFNEGILREGQMNQYFITVYRTGKTELKQLNNISDLLIDNTETFYITKSKLDELLNVIEENRDKIEIEEVKYEGSDSNLTSFALPNIPVDAASHKLILYKDGKIDKKYETYSGLANENFENIYWKVDSLKEFSHNKIIKDLIDYVIYLYA